MKDREEWSPLLEEDVDHLVRNQTRRRLEGDDAFWTLGPFGTTRSKEGVGADVGREPARLLRFLFESLCMELELKDGVWRVDTYQRVSVHSNCLQSRNRGLRRRAKEATAGP